MTPERPSPHPLGWHREWPWIGVVFACLLSLYLATAPRNVVLEDDGLFILSSYFLGIEHPPGYPLFVLLGKLATLVPLGTVAWRVHAMAGLFAALACVFVYRIARCLMPGRAPALFAALGLGVSQTFWSQAIIADVYSLHALIFFALLYWAVSEHREPSLQARQTERRLDRSALVCGLGVANHWPLLLLSGPALMLLWLPRHRTLLRRLPRLLLLFALGLLPYAWLMWRSHQHPDISFQGPIDSWAEFVRFFLREGYAQIDHKPSAGISDQLLYSAYLLRLGATQLLLPGLMLALLGALEQWRRLGWLISAALTLAFVGPTLLLTLLLRFDYEPQLREAFRVYPVVAWGIMALWAALGLQQICARWKWSQRPAIQDAIVVTLIAGTLLVYWPINDRHDDWFADAYAHALLASPPPGSVFLISGEAALPCTAYLHLVEGVRPDLSLISEPALILEPKLFDPERTQPAAAKRTIDAYANDTRRPVFRMHNRDARSGTLHWLGFQLDPSSAPGSGAVTFAWTASDRAFLTRIANHEPFHDGWNELLRRALLADFTDFLTRAELLGQPLSLDAELSAIRDAILRFPDAALSRAELLARVDPVAHAEEIDRLLARFQAGLTDPWVNKRQLGRFYNMLAERARRQGNADALRQAIDQSLSYWAEPENPAHATARQLDGSGVSTTDDHAGRGSNRR